MAVVRGALSRLQGGRRGHRPAAGPSSAEQHRLYGAIQESLRTMVEAGGRDGEYDLHGRPGGYRRVLHSKAVGQPHPRCGASIETANYLGGDVCLCPTCQA